MGNEKSKGKVLVTLDRDMYFTGERVTGQVFLHLSRRIRTEMIWLKVTCSETVQWTNSLGSMRSPVTNLLLSQKYPLFSWEGGEAMPGSYAFPYEIVLPATLPGSFAITKHDMNAAIKYYVEAEICGKKTRIIDRCCLTARQQVPNSICPGLSEVAGVIGSSCCRGKGVVSVKVASAKTYFSPSETAIVTVEVDNSRGRVRITGIHASLHQTVRLLSGKPGEKGEKISKVLIQSYSMQTEIRPQEVREGENALHIALDLSQVSEQLASSATTSGHLISCGYTLEVEPDLDSSAHCVGIAPRCTMALVIYSAAPRPRKDVPEAPVDWHPQVMPPSLLRVSPEFDYQPSAPPLEESDITMEFAQA